MKVLVIGGSRFIGRRIVERLLERGHDVTCLNRGNAPAPSGASTLVGDRRQDKVVATAVRDLVPDAVVDMVAMTEDDAKGLPVPEGVRVVVASSCDVYRNFGGVNGKEELPPDPVPLTEKSPLRTRLYPYRGSERSAEIPWLNDYDKILVEREVTSKGATAVRLPMVYGPLDYQRRTRDVLRRMDADRSVCLGSALAGWRGCRGFVDNMAEAFVLATESPEGAGEVFVVADEDGLDVELDWVQAIGKAAGWNGHVTVVPEADLPADLKSDGVFEFDANVSARKFRETFGDFAIVTSDEALERTVAWERSNPPTDEAELDSRLEDWARANGRITQ